MEHTIAQEPLMINWSLIVKANVFALIMIIKQVCIKSICSEHELGFNIFT